MYKKTLSSIIVIILFIGVIFFSGCTDNNGSEGELRPSLEEVEEDTSLYVGGNKGLVVSFYSNKPPSELRRFLPFEVSFKLENKGEYIISDINRRIRVFISGISPFTYGLLETHKSPFGEDLQGVHKIGNTVVPGGITEVTFYSTGYRGPAVPEGGKWEQILNGRVCYPYQTEVVSNVCLKSNIYKDSIGSSVCSIIGSKEFENSGAPIQVTKVEATPTGTNKIAFRITIKNEGNNYPYLGAISNCEDLGIGDVDRIILSNMECGNLNLKCISGCSSQSGGIIMLYNGEAIITIEGEIPSTSPSIEYEEMLVLRFSYNYFEDLSKRISVLGGY